MKPFLLTTAFSVLLFSFNASAQTSDRESSLKYSENKQSYIEFQCVTPSVTGLADVTKANTKEIIPEKLLSQNSSINAGFGTTSIKYWVDDKQGRYYHFSSSSDNFIYNPESRSCKIFRIDRIMIRKWNEVLHSRIPVTAFFQWLVLIILTETINYLEQDNTRCSHGMYRGMP